MKAVQLLLASVLLSIGLTGNAQDIFKGYEALFTPPRSYTVLRTSERINLDGKSAEAAWSKVPWSESFVDIEGEGRATPRHKTRFKLLWDTSALYVYVELEETHIWASLHQRDTIIYHDNDIEIFIDPDGDTYEYFEIELNAHNTVFDLLMPRPYRNGGKAKIKWDAVGFNSAVQVLGTLNNPADKDAKWAVEMAIPFRSLGTGENTRMPVAGDWWRINLSRVQWDLDVVNDQYVKRKNANTGRPLPEHNWVWSPQGVVNMHYPERWGYTFFSAKLAGSTLTPVAIPPTEDLKKYLWLVYYKQQAFRRKERRYAASLAELELPATVKSSGVQANLGLTATNDEFQATISTQQGRWKINESGMIIKEI